MTIRVGLGEKYGNCRFTVVGTLVPDNKSAISAIVLDESVDFHYRTQENQENRRKGDAMSYHDIVQHTYYITVGAFIYDRDGLMRRRLL